MTTKKAIERVREHYEEVEELRHEVKELRKVSHSKSCTIGAMQRKIDNRDKRIAELSELCRDLWCTVSWADGVTQGKKDEYAKRLKEAKVDA